MEELREKELPLLTMGHASDSDVSDSEDEAALVSTLTAAPRRRRVSACKRITTTTTTFCLLLFALVGATVFLSYLKSKAGCDAYAAMEEVGCFEPDYACDKERKCSAYAREVLIKCTVPDNIATVKEHGAKCNAVAHGAAATCQADEKRCYTPKKQAYEPAKRVKTTLSACALQCNAQPDKVYTVAIITRAGCFCAKELSANKFTFMAADNRVETPCPTGSPGASADVVYTFTCT